jgi:hypothetical protein
MADPPMGVSRQQPRQGPALNICTNYFNPVAETAIDFPKVEALPNPGS